MNACIMNTYVIAAAMKGIKLEEVEMKTEGELDLRGFLGIAENIIPDYKELKYKVRLKGDGKREQYEEVHKTVVATSFNYYNISQLGQKGDKPNGKNSHFFESTEERNRFTFSRQGPFP